MSWALDCWPFHLFPSKRFHSRLSSIQENDFIFVQFIFFPKDCFILCFMYCQEDSFLFMWSLSRQCFHLRFIFPSFFSLFLKRGTRRFVFPICIINLFLMSVHVLSRSPYNRWPVQYWRGEGLFRQDDWFYLLRSISHDQQLLSRDVSVAIIINAVTTLFRSTFQGDILTQFIRRNACSISIDLQSIFNAGKLAIYVWCW